MTECVKHFADVGVHLQMPAHPTKIIIVKHVYGNWLSVTIQHEIYHAMAGGRSLQPDGQRLDASAGHSSVRLVCAARLAGIRTGTSDIHHLVGNGDFQLVHEIQLWVSGVFLSGLLLWLQLLLGLLLFPLSS